MKIKDNFIRRMDLAKKKDIVILVRSTDRGKDAWWYVKCFDRIAAEKLKGECRAKQLETIPLAEYGEVVKSGWGDSPPEEVVREMEEKYG